MITGISHPKIFNRSTRSTITVTDDVIVGQYLRILILSELAELDSDPNYGCSLRSLIFSPNDLILTDMAKDSIVKAIKIYAPNITVKFEDINITQDEESITIEVRYTTANKIHSSVVEFTILNSEVMR